jgi:hypothetical protein
MIILYKYLKSPSKQIHLGTRVYTKTHIIHKYTLPCSSLSFSFLYIIFLLQFTNLGIKESFILIEDFY